MQAVAIRNSLDDHSNVFISIGLTLKVQTSLDGDQDFTRLIIKGEIQDLGIFGNGNHLQADGRFIAKSCIVLEQISRERLILLRGFGSCSRERRQINV